MTKEDSIFIKDLDNKNCLSVFDIEKLKTLYDGVGVVEENDIQIVITINK